MLTCISCTDSVGDSDLQLTCTNEHTLCIDCLQTYVKHCCETAATQDTIPITCSVCDWIVPQHTLAALIGSFDELWSLYQHVQLQVALDANHEEIPLTCSFCYEYTEMMLPVSPGYWQRLEEIRARKMADIEIRLKDFMMTGRILKTEEHYADMAALRKEEKSRCEAIDVKYDKIIRKKAAERFENEFKDAVKIIDPEPLMPAELRELNRLKQSSRSSEEDLRYSELEEKYLHYVYLATEPDPKIAILQNLKAEILTELQNDILAEKEQINKHVNEEIQRMIHDHEQELVDFEKPFIDQMKMESKNVKNAMFFGEMKEEYDEAKEANASSQFFVCKRDCTGAFCIRCELPLEKKEIDEHLCELTAVEDLYRLIIWTLAEASVMRCPSCKRPGMKDLACCHMKCKCGQLWCYHCGLSSDELGRTHNQWYLNDQDGKCPKLLQQKYGDREFGHIMDGDPKSALAAFHLVKQKEALMKVEQESDEVVWTQVMNKYFPNGLWE